MKDSSKHLPIVCRLLDPALRARKAAIRMTLWPLVKSVTELPGGYAFQVAGDERVIATVAKWAAAERKCCRFLRFEAVAEPDLGPVTLRITGPPGTREFLRSILFESPTESPTGKQ